MSEQMPHDVTSLAVMVGEIRGQMREVVHTLNNVSSKIDGLSSEVVKLGPLAARLFELEANYKLQQAEINQLKSERDQRKGAVGLIEWIVKHWPGVIGFALLVGLVLRTEGKL